MEVSFKLHFEQPGKIEGLVELDGEQIDVNCYSIRDGSHGSRFLEKTIQGGYTWSTADYKTGFHLIAPDLNNCNETVVLGGYILRDGIIAPIIQGVRRVLERVSPRPDVIEVEVEDSPGQKLHARGRATVPAEFMLFPRSRPVVGAI